ncbi:MAG TPA: Ig-like domain-containing protein, partial [Pyrinomonadaceae bacterium]|nr:Ig-like domain-containing protein [Pyrinomonadaceae bacterium]
PATGTGSQFATGISSPVDLKVSEDGFLYYLARTSGSVGRIGFDGSGGGGGEEDNTPPTVSITNPANGAIVPRRSTVTITATASDNVGVTRVEFRVDGTLRCTDTTAPYSCNWSVPRTFNRTYQLSARAFDAAGNSATATIQVTGR